ncbi:MAG: hypothetical protein B7Z36_06130 [Novosphingobium sp. 12-63-9]|nr:MAG: hypothetical protein B7Z36_06130 [Novosphingobium sp. 12-63-9]
MSQSLIETLPAPQRLALAYAPARAKPRTLVLFALEARLAQAVRQASEPIMAQMRLAWWRDQLALPVAKRENSDALAASLTLFEGEEIALQALVDGWEVLLSEWMDLAAVERIAAGRAAGFTALARLSGADHAVDDALRAGRRFALADLATKFSNSEERAQVLALAGAERGQGIALPRALRSLAVLDGLARRSIARGGAPLLDGPASALTAIRLGLVGR